jgi:hypothetical protein
MHEQLLDFLLTALYQEHSQSTRSLPIPGSALLRRTGTQKGGEGTGALGAGVLPATEFRQISGNTTMTKER